MAYVARRDTGDRIVTHVAGLHAIGSFGAVEYLAATATELYNATDGNDFSLLVESSYAGLTTTSFAAAGAPLCWDH